MRVELTAEEVGAARRYSALVLATPTMDKPNYSNLHGPLRFFIGELGELAFEKLVQGRGLDYRRMNNSEGRPDDCDFLIGGKKIDVKTTLHPRAKWLAMHPEQLERRKPSDFFVGVTGTVNDDDSASMVIHGWISSREFLARSVLKTIITPTRVMNLSDLRAFP